MNVPEPLLTQRLFALPPRSRAVVLLDEDERRATRAAGVLLDRGYKDVQVRVLDENSPPLEGWASGTEVHRGWEPAPFLIEALDRIARVRPARTRERTHAPRRSIPGTEAPMLDADVLDLACGAGRNTVHLALQGASAFGVDILPDSVRQGAILARMAGAAPGRARFRTFDLTRQPQRLLHPGRYAAILCFRYLDRNLFSLMTDALSPGGWLIFQTFLVDQRTHHGKPRSDRHLLRPGELDEAFGRLQRVVSREGREPDGNWYSTLLARKPA